MNNLRELISQCNSINVLMIVYSNPGINQKEAIRGEGQNSRLKRLKEFVDAGLIREAIVSEGRTNNRYYLTPEGERLAVMWLELEGKPREDRHEESRVGGSWL